MTVDKLGVKLYDKVSAVIAELVANSYDADATEVSIEAPMGSYLATSKSGVSTDQGFHIIVGDNGSGMSPDVVNPFYLKVGGERRKDKLRGDTTPRFGRKVMGRKGVGKLAPFGICDRIEVRTAGGEVVDGVDALGNPARGYRMAHFIMRRSMIMEEGDDDYLPEVGDMDQVVVPHPGTVLILSDFVRRQVPEMTTFGRQLAQRFGVASPNWRIQLIDSTQTASSPNRTAMVGTFDIQTLPGSLVHFDGPSSEAMPLDDAVLFSAKNEAGERIEFIEAGFTYEDGRFYPIRGWIAYARQSYRDDLMAGVRIYCRGKIAAQTAVFNLRSGFTGEYVTRSYLVGELHADWLDESEDLIQTDRRDILWSDGLGQAFEEWGQRAVKVVAMMSREPVSRKVAADFLKVGNVLERIDMQFPGDEWKPIRDTTLEIARLMGSRLREGELQDSDHVDALVDLSLMLGPHVTLDKTLRDAADDSHGALSVVSGILRTARVAELSSYGMIAEKRVQVIHRIMELKDDPEQLEAALQDSLEEAPWLINPQWSPITANHSLASLKTEFEKYFSEQYGETIVLNNFSASNKRPDFVLSSQDFGLQIIEIKRPKHKIKNAEWDRIEVYMEAMDGFLDKPGHDDFKRIYKGFFVTLVCDEIGLTGSQRSAFRAAEQSRRVEHITWTTFLRRTEQMHKEFLSEANRQRQIALVAPAQQGLLSGPAT